MSVYTPPLLYFFFMLFLGWKKEPSVSAALLQENGGGVGAGGGEQRECSRCWKACTELGRLSKGGFSLSHCLLPHRRSTEEAWCQDQRVLEQTAVAGWFLFS